MGDVYRKLSAGAPVSALSRTVYNDTIDMLRWWKSQFRTGGGPQPAGELDPSIVLVKNNSGSACDRFGVLGIYGPLFTCADNAAEFKNRPALVGVSPTLSGHLGNFVVLLEPVANGKIAPAVVSGLVPCQVKVESTASNPVSGQAWYEYADVEAATTGRLILRPYGAAHVIWKAGSSAGDQWALVRLGNPAGIVQLRGTLSGALSQGSYADASLVYKGANYTQRVYDLLMKTGAADIASGKEIVATYWPDEQLFYVTEAECP